MTEEKKDLGPTEIGMQPNVAALLSYLLGFITGIIFIVLEKKNKFVRFHAMQSIVVFGFLFALQVVNSYLIASILWSLARIIAAIIPILTLVLWIILMVKAYKGEFFKIPYAGDIAEKNS